MKEVENIEIQNPENVDTNDLIDKLEVALISNFQMEDAPVEHTFVPGLYIRQITMYKGQKVTSLIHKTNHPYFILKGMVSVFSKNEGTKILKAGDHGITTPNTRRVLFVHEETIWVTVHPTNIQPDNDSKEAVEEAVAKIGAEIIDWRGNELIGAIIKNNVLIEKGDLITY